MMNRLLLLSAAIIVGLVLLFLIVYGLRHSRRLTKADSHHCKVKPGSIDVTRIRRNWLQKLLDPIVPLKRYNCNYCERNFLRLKPLNKNGHGIAEAG